MGCHLDPQSFKAEESCQTTGGMSRKMLYALPDHIDFPFPSPLEKVVDFAGAATVYDDFTMKPNMGFHIIEADVQSSSLDAKSVGEPGNLSAETDYKFMLSGKSKAMVGFLNSFRNKPLILIVPDNDGNDRLMGNERLPAQIVDFKEASGTKVADSKMYEVTIRSYGNIPYFFEGPAGIPLA